MLKTIFLHLVLLCLILSCSSVEKNPRAHNDSLNLFSQELRKLVSRKLRKRDGVVLWKDLKKENIEVFGNQDLLHQRFSPGSVAKLLTAELAVHKNKQLDYYCTGQGRLQNRRKVFCWNYHGHKRVQLHQAIAVSCNLYFLNLAEKLEFLEWKQNLDSYTALKNPSLQFSLQSQKDLKWALGEAEEMKWTPQETLYFWQEFISRLQQPEYEEIFLGLKQVAEKGGTAEALAEVSFEVLAKTGTIQGTQGLHEKNAWLLVAFPEKEPRFLMIIFLKRSRAYQQASDLAKEILLLVKKYETL